MRVLCAFLLIACTSSAAAAEPDAAIPDALQRYVDRPEPDYGWELLATHETEHGTVHELLLVSQKWQDIVWKHSLLVYEPPRIDHPEHMLLMVTGGRTGRRPDQDDMQLGLKLAALCGARIATLHQVPNQPLLGDRVEDDLITETWLKYLETGDETWPLLFPMVKSAVKAMDALTEFSADRWETEVKGFVMTGASKRGWTSWLTPVADKRVIATAPLVIDTLNFPVQMQYQLDTWGDYSEQIHDYTSKGLVRPEGEPRTPREEQLWQMMDPYTYRSVLKLPKLLVNGTNDPYWVVDAMNNYWNDLEGPKFILQVPNAGHGLDGGRESALTTVAVFFRHAAMGRSLPAMSWAPSNSGGRLKLQVQSDPRPVDARLWSAVSSTKDFRKSEWTSAPLQERDQDYEGSLELPDRGHGAVFGELQFDFSGLVYSLTTQVFRQ